MNVYDFDKTIYDGDATLDFYFFCLKKNILLLRYLTIQVYGFLLYKFSFCNKTRFKEYFYCFFSGIKDIDKYIDMFWKEHEKKMKKWYIEQKKSNDVIISASPKFLIKPICNKVGIQNVIASNVDKKTGKYIGVNCYGKEKVKRYKQVFGNQIIDNFYSDSDSDYPMVELSKTAYKVKGNFLEIWNRNVK